MIDPMPSPSKLPNAKPNRVIATAVFDGFSVGVRQSSGMPLVDRSLLSWYNAGKIAGAKQSAKLAGGLEHDEQRAVFSILDLLEPLDPIRIRSIHAVPNGGLRAKAVAGKLKAEGVKAGIPDICAPFPSTIFHSLRLEMKSMKGAESAQQKAVLADLAALGNKCAVCRGWRTGIEEIAGYLWPAQ